MMDKQKVIIVQTLFSKCALRAQKANIVRSFSDGRTEHITELDDDEVRRLIGYLRYTARDAARTPTQISEDKMKRKIISMAHELRWRNADGKIDMKSLNGWCVKYGYLHKRLDDYSNAELPRLVQQFEVMYRNFLRNR